MIRSKPVEILLAVAVIAAFGISKLLTWRYMPSHEIDAVLPFDVADLALPSALLELAVAGAILRINNPKVACYVCLGFGLALVGARYIYIANGGTLANCPCLGGIPGLWPAVEFYKGNILITTVLWIPMLALSGLLRTQSIPPRAA
jgi:hypothetical protein